MAQAECLIVYRGWTHVQRILVLELTAVRQSNTSEFFMNRKFVWMPLGAIVMASAIASMPADANENNRYIRGFFGDTDIVDVDELDRERRRDVFNVIDDFQDDLEDVVGRRQANRIVRSIRNGDEVNDIVDDLDLSRGSRRDLDDVFDDIRDGIEDVLD